jgi:hypothetical protein
VILVAWPIPEVLLILAAPGAATMFFPTAVAMSIARPTTVGSRKAAVAGPIAGHLPEALIVRILRVSGAQVVPIVIRVHGVPAGAAVDVRVEDADRIDSGLKSIHRDLTWITKGMENDRKNQEDPGNKPGRLCVSLGVDVRRLW